MKKKKKKKKEKKKKKKKKKRGERRGEIKMRSLPSRSSHLNATTASAPPAALDALSVCH